MLHTSGAPARSEPQAQHPGVWHPDTQPSPVPLHPPVSCVPQPLAPRLASWPHWPLCHPWTMRSTLLLTRWDRGPGGPVKALPGSTALQSQGRGHPTQVSSWPGRGRTVTPPQLKSGAGKLTLLAFPSLLLQTPSSQAHSRASSHSSRKAVPGEAGLPAEGHRQAGQLTTGSPTRLLGGAGWKVGDQTGERSVQQGHRLLEPGSMKGQSKCPRGGGTSDRTIQHTRLRESEQMQWGEC